MDEKHAIQRLKQGNIDTEVCAAGASGDSFSDYSGYFTVDFQ
jgi:hypothetical protein